MAHLPLRPPSLIEQRRPTGKPANTDPNHAEPELVVGFGEALPAPTLGGVEDDGTNGHALRLLSMQDRRGINALAEDQTIVFNPRVMILFGENATGKKGYVRVLKRVAAVRSAEECTALRAPNVTLGFPGRQGRAVWHKSVTADHSLTEGSRRASRS